MKKISKKQIFLIFLITIFLGITLFMFLQNPSNDRNWSEDQTVLPYAEIENNLVTIHNIRNFSYTSESAYTKNYYDKTFDLDKIEKAWFVVEPFSGIPGSAHTFVSFEFADDNFVAISVEIRKEKGESFHPVTGLFRQYEITYNIADENDVIKLRSNFRKDQVFLYPSNAGKEMVKKLFLDMVGRANYLKNNPEFYNTITNTCTTNIADHINNILPNQVPFLDWRITFPANSDKLAYDLDMFDTDLSFEEARKYFNINERAEKYENDPNFSRKIRVRD